MIGNFFNLKNKKDLANSFKEMTQPLVFQSAFLMFIYIYNRIINCFMVSMTTLEIFKLAYI